MPHTRAARLKALKAARECNNMQQIPYNAINLDWNDSLTWDLPGSTYQPDALAWYPSEKTTLDQMLPCRHIQNPTVAATSLSNTICGPSSTTDFRGLQPWCSTSVQDLPSVTAATISPFSRSGSGYTSCDFTSLDDSQLWPPNIICQTSSLSDEVSQKLSDEPAMDLNEELDGYLAVSPEVQSGRVSNVKLDTSKKRKIAHSLVEQKYRSRILDGMAELRHCLPSPAKVRSSCDSKHPKEKQAAEDAKLNHSTGKVATLSNAVQYVRALELQIKALHTQLDVMQRRNHALQRIALSKYDHSTNKTILRQE